MKKLLSLVMTTALLLTLSMAGMAEVTVLENAGLSIDLPEGFQATDASDPTAGTISISIVNVNNPMIIYGISGSYIEDLAEFDLATADDAQKDALLQQFGTTEGILAEIVTDEEGVTYLEMADEAGSRYMQLFIEEGTLQQYTVMKMDGSALTEEEITTLHTLAASVLAVEGEGGEAADPTTEETQTPGEEEAPEEDEAA